MASNYNPYQGATYEQMATYLSQKTGLDYHVAYNWLRAEGSQISGNPLGVGGTQHITYSSWQAGLDAAVALLKSNSLYRGIWLAIHTGNPAAERQSIVLSPWSGSSHYGGGAHFSTAGIGGSTYVPPGSPPGTQPTGIPPSDIVGQQGLPGIPSLQAIEGFSVGILVDVLVLVVIVVLAFSGLDDLLGGTASSGVRAAGELGG